MKLGIPRFGLYSDVIKAFLESLGIDVIMAPKITRDIIKAGVANSSDFFCFPFKYTLGQEIWCLEQGATDLIFYNSCGICRLKHYHQIQELTLKELGYHFKMNVATRKNLLKMIRQLGHISRLQAYRRLKGVYSEIRAIEARTYRFLPTRDLKIGIVGEIGCYSADMEILTDRGWRLFKDLDKEDKVLQVDPQTLEMTFVTPGLIYSSWYKGEMIHFKGMQIDLMVTPNHRMLYEGSYKRRRKIKRADELPFGSYIFKAGEWQGGEIEVKHFGPITLTPKQYCKFMGIWLAEGCVSSPDYREKDSCGRAKGGYRKRYYVFITQKKPEVRAKIEELLKEIGITIDYNDYSKSAAGSYSQTTLKTALNIPSSHLVFPGG
ncbi:unnamed protein product [marine sediment metagenome]|uniref:Hint domain-containing protein n=1 Tax=marine sediment metagenome TaxID=412755 RepID=X1L119_9ZZZZ